MDYNNRQVVRHAKPHEVMAMAHRKTEARPVVEQVAHLLRQRVIHGQYPPGTFLPSERALAGELGVSRMSVSRALEQLAREGIVKQHIGAGTRVLPDAGTRLPPGTIAILHRVFVGAPSPEPSLILQGMVDALAREHFAYEMVPVLSSDYEGPVEKAVTPGQILQMRNRYGGWLFVETCAAEQTVALHRLRAPVVVANLESELEVSATWVDHERIARTAVEILAALGHRRIGLVATVPSRAFYEKTIQGYRDSLKRLGVPMDARWLSLCPNSSALDAYSAATNLLRVEPRPTAIVAGRDLHAEGVCRAASEAGLTIGRDLSVIGFDNVTWPLESPLLTTFHEPCYELGAEAARMLIDRMHKETAEVEKKEISAPLVLRRSAGPPADVAPDSQPFSARLHMDA